MYFYVFVMWGESQMCAVMGRESYSVLPEKIPENQQLL
jgi:hypothetical protein